MASSYTFRNVARMEWIKLRTLRSVRWTLLLALAGMIGIGIAAGFNTRNPNGDVTNNILTRSESSRDRSFPGHAAQRHAVGQALAHQ